MVTPETLTDEMIDQVESHAAKLGDHQTAADCQLARMKRDRHWTRFKRKRQYWARERIAASINALNGVKL